MNAVVGPPVKKPEHENGKGEPAQQHQQPYNKTGLGADQAEREGNEQAQGRIAHREQRLVRLAPRGEFHSPDGF